MLQPPGELFAGAGDDDAALGADLVVVSGADDTQLPANGISDSGEDYGALS